MNFARWEWRELVKIFSQQCRYVYHLPAVHGGVATTVAKTLLEVMAIRNADDPESPWMED